MDHTTNDLGLETPKRTSSVMNSMKSLQHPSGNHIDVSTPTEGGIKPCAQVSKAVHQLKGVSRQHQSWKRFAPLSANDHRPTLGRIEDNLLEQGP